MKLSLIGNGFMAQALAKGLVNDFDVEIIGRDFKKLETVKKQVSKVEIKEISDMENITDKNLILCVKPYALESVATRLQGQCNILFSILAGTTLDSLKKQIKSKYYIRTMPNIAAAISKSITTITGDFKAKNLAIDLFNCIGKTVWVNTEKQLDIASAITGSGPAFLSLIAEGISDGAVKAGLERNISNELTQGLFESFSQLLKDKHPALIKDCITSPQGTTIAGIAQLEESCVRSSMMKAIEATHNRAVEIGKK